MKVWFKMFIFDFFIYNSFLVGLINFVDYLKRKLDVVDWDLFDIEYGVG